MSTICTPTQSSPNETTTAQLCNSQAIAAFQNPVPHIERSPDEILLNIFRYLVQPASGIPCGAQYGSELLHASRVCGRWRAIAIGNASLWTEIQVSGAVQAKLFLERSRPLPIRIALADSLFEGDREDICKEIVPHISRIRAFVISGAQRAKELQWWMKKLDAPAPRLEELTLTTVQESNIGSNVEGLSIFGNHTPRLRSLTVRGVDFDRGASSLLSNLRNLSLTLWLEDFGPLRLSHTVLQRCPELETLALRGRYRHSDPQQRASEDGLPRTVVALPRLSKLELNLSAQDTMHMLQLLSLPQSTTFEIEIESPSRPVHFPRALIEQQLPALHRLPCVEVVISDDWVGGYTDQSFTLYAGHGPALDTYTLCLSVSCTSTPWICNLRLMLDVDAIQDYTVDLNNTRPHAKFTPKLWHLALRGLTELKTLRVLDAAREAYPNLCAVLASAEERVCPALEVLELCGVACDAAFFRSLQDMLASRSAVLRPLRSIRIKDAAHEAYRGPELEDVRAMLDELRFL